MQLVWSLRQKWGVCWFEAHYSALYWSHDSCYILSHRWRPKNDLQFIHSFVFPFDPAFNPGVGPLSCAKLWGKMLIVACAGRRLRNRGPSCSTWFRQTETRFYSRRHHTTHILLPPVISIRSHGESRSLLDRIDSVLLLEMISNFDKGLAQSITFGP